jgi:hypothetical protein
MSMAYTTTYHADDETAATAPSSFQDERDELVIHYLHPLPDIQTPKFKACACTCASNYQRHEEYSAWCLYDKSIPPAVLDTKINTTSSAPSSASPSPSLSTTSMMSSIDTAPSSLSEETSVTTSDDEYARESHKAHLANVIFPANEECQVEISQAIIFEEHQCQNFITGYAANYFDDASTSLLLVPVVEVLNDVQDDWLPPLEDMQLLNFFMP